MVSLISLLSDSNAEVRAAGELFFNLSGIKMFVAAGSIGAVINYKCIIEVKFLQYAYSII